MVVCGVVAGRGRLWRSRILKLPWQPEEPAPDLRGSPAVRCGMDAQCCLREGRDRRACTIARGRKVSEPVNGSRKIPVAPVPEYTLLNGLHGEAVLFSWVDQLPFS
jgi:hypothetical protein